MNIDRIKHEIARLKQSPSTYDSTEGIGIVRFIVRCPFGAAKVLDNAKYILMIVANNSFGDWPDDSEWNRLLPKWFVDACAPSPSQEEAERWLKMWKCLSPHEQAEAEIKRDWSLDNWLYWMKPENRQWIWWDGEVVPYSDHVIVAVEVDCWPFPWGALRWLFKVCGASEVTADFFKDKSSLGVISYA
ncbi:MAG: hypothetical protein JJU29_20350, partial [Verrucomicrobia bacterium]|nr:hypothetical protein [Verrucomicrobiota bacterium]